MALGLRSDGGGFRFSSQQTPGRIPSKRPRSRLQEEEDSLWLPPSSSSSPPLSSSSRNPTGYEKGPPPSKKVHHAPTTTADTGVAQGVYGSLPLTADSLSLGSGGFRDYGAELQMKADHTHRPLWVCKDGCILLEMFSVASRQANELLLTIAEPICRGDFVHEFQVRLFFFFCQSIHRREAKSRRPDKGVYLSPLTLSMHLSISLGMWGVVIQWQLSLAGRLVTLGYGRTRDLLLSFMALALSLVSLLSHVDLQLWRCPSYCSLVSRIYS